LRIAFRSGGDRSLGEIYDRLVGPSAIATWLIFTAFLIIAALVTSRFALSIPAVVLDNFAIRGGFFLSNQLTENRSPILVILVTKSILGGYIAGKLPTREPPVRRLMRSPAAHSEAFGVITRKPKPRSKTSGAQCHPKMRISPVDPPADLRMQRRTDLHLC